MHHKIIPFIRCTDNAVQVSEYYASIFPGTKIGKKWSAVVDFEIFGQSLAAFNGGEHAEGKVNPSISFSVWINDKNLTKQIRDKLMDGWEMMMEFAEYPRSPSYGRCNDKYGVSRQVMYNEQISENKLIPSFLFVWANTGKAEEAIHFYTSLFPASKIDWVGKYDEQAGADDKAEHIAHAEFNLVDQKFIIADSGLQHNFAFNNGISLMVSCKDQAEIDHYRDAFIADGWQEIQCGRCKDKYGVSRQIVPIHLGKLLSDPDTEKSGRATQAMLEMKKLDIAKLKEAYNGG